MWRIAVSLVLVAAVLFVYAPVRRHEFVNFDDPLYVGSEVVRAPLDGALLLRLLREPVNALWHPLAMLSHVLDQRLFGTWAGGHHLTSVALHAANAVLLLLLLEAATGAFWPSAFVAAAFALHPLRVESVAWAAERKDVLSAFFGLASGLAYVAWRHRPGRGRYALVVLGFALAVAAKPMLVTWPVVLLVLDAWPLGRLRSRRDLWPLLVEKLPLLAIALAVGLATIRLQDQGGAVVSLGDVPLTDRLGSAVVGVLRYLQATVWPVGLAPFYPYARPTAAAVALALLVAVGATVGAFLLRRPAPWLLAGWAWYLTMLAPVSGVLQSGTQAWADRFGYLPLVGIWIALAWSGRALAARSPFARGAVAIGAVTLLAGWGIASARQVAWWRDSETLFARTLEVTDGNYLAHNNLGEALAARGRREDAARHYAEAVRLNPRYAPALNNLANTLAQQGRTVEAEVRYREALASRRELPEAHNGLGVLLAERGQYAEAIDRYRRALELREGYAEARVNLAHALRRAGRPAEAIAAYRAALALRPDWNDVCRGLAAALAAAGDLPAAATTYEDALARDPRDDLARAGLASVLLAQGRTDDARRVAHAARAAGDHDLARQIDEALARSAAAPAAP
ncbi:MAG: tetratricopeptide repeat protein [Deltaproteobacteria bacterium]|nr:tetratricopeptide repeat protein [Deltaproteobacteria bacterium]